MAVHHGAGRHTDVLTPAAASASVYYILIAFVFGVFSFSVPKFAVLILLTKILDPGVNHRRVMWVISVVYSLLAAGMVVINYAQCEPASKQWGGTEGTCWPRTNTFAYSLALGSAFSPLPRCAVLSPSPVEQGLTGTTVCSALFDFYLAVYPTVVLTRLNMGWKKKLGLSSALGFGYW